MVSGLAVTAALMLWLLTIWMQLLRLLLFLWVLHSAATSTEPGNKSLMLLPKAATLLLLLLLLQMLLCCCLANALLPWQLLCCCGCC